MKFYVINEDLKNQTFYHASDVKFTYFKPNEEGVHISNTKEGAIDVAKDRLKNAKNIYLYTCRYLGIMKPIELSGDIQFYSARDIADMIINKLTGQSIFASTPDSKRRKQGGAIATYIPADEFNISAGFIDSLTDDDIEYLKNIPEYADVEDIKNLGKWIVKNFGYNCITYPLSESDRGAMGILVLDPSKINIIACEELKDIVKNKRKSIDFKWKD